MSTTRYVMRILDDAQYWSDIYDPTHHHLERWVVELDAEKRGLVTSHIPADAKTFKSREAVREYWLRTCPPGKPWDFWEGGIVGDGESQPLTRYMVMIETLHEAEKQAEQTPKARWDGRINGNR